MNLAGISKGDDISKELSLHQIRKDNEDLQSTIDSIKDCLNPFDPQTSSGDLVCLSSGRVCSESVKNDMLNCKNIGKRNMTKFIDECQEDCTRFDRAISSKKDKVKSFSSDAVVMKKKTN